MKLAERSAAKQNLDRGSLVVFPFLTTLAISGGLFLLAFQITPLLVPKLMSG